MKVDEVYIGFDDSNAERDGDGKWVEVLKTSNVSVDRFYRKETNSRGVLIIKLINSVEALEMIENANILAESFLDRKE